MAWTSANIFQRPPSWSPTADDSDSSSSDGSIPNVRPVRSFKPYDGKRKESLSAGPSTSGDGNDPDEDLVTIRSDIQQTAPQQHPEEAARNLDALAVSSPAGQGSQTRPAKRPITDAKRERLRQIMRERWASGMMDHVHDKRMATLKRKASALGPDDAAKGQMSKKSASSTERRSDPAGRMALTVTPQPSGAEYPAQALKLWQYIQPHLTVFRNQPIPIRYCIPELLLLPRLRDVQLNSHRSRHFSDSTEKKVAAMLVYLTGKKASQPCLKCLCGNGRFNGCVKLSPDTLLGARIRHCANCWYTNQACTYDTAATGDLTGMGEVAKPESDSDMDDTFHHLAEKTVPPEIVPRLPAIWHSVSGRRYYVWPDKSGKMAVMSGGMLLPDAYEPDPRRSDTAWKRLERPWKCPVDDCRRPFTTLKALSCHFPRIHHAAMLNDNCNGTFSTVGLYDNPKLGNGGSYLKDPPSFPYVVSQTPKPLVEKASSDSDSSDELLIPPVGRNSRRMQDDDVEDEEEVDHFAEQLLPPRGNRLRNLRNQGLGNGGARGLGPAGSRLVAEIRQRPRSPEREASSTVSISRANPEEILEMEEWEIAPGRVRSEASEASENVALSRAYLTSNKTVQIHHDLAVRVDVIQPGSTLHFEPTDGKMRSCFVASGKVRVKMDGESEFAIGPHGHFQIRPGVAGSAQNRLYIDSVLHVTTMTVYD